MTGTCIYCRNLVFHNIEPGTYLAEFHADEASLRNAAQMESCDFCVAVQGMVDHRHLWSPTIPRRSEYEPSADQAISVSLFFSQDSEDSDEWEYLEDESGWKDAEYSIVVNHPLGFFGCRVRSLDFLGQAGDRESPATEHFTSKEGMAASTGSDENIALAASWLKACRGTHESCQRPRVGSGAHPNRLLDVSNATDPGRHVRLVECDEWSASERPSYVTLSHRWNPENACFTTTSNLQIIRKRGLLIRDLSPTFAQACLTAFKLGFRFMWIDSLCIIQDLDSDKAAEIPKMADYYQNAELNIAASAQGKDGLWRTRAAGSNKHFTIRITLKDSQASRDAILTATPILRAQRSHLDHRAWIFQERVFPMRTLFFDPYWIAFECNHMSASEACPEGVLNSAASPVRLPILMATDIERDCSLSLIGGVIRNQLSLQLDGSITDRARERELLTLWYRIVSEYSLRQMTFESDRLDAISGLVARMAGILNDEFIGGIWRRDLVNGLQWHASRLGPNPVAFRQSEYHAPTWSWASTIVRRSEDAIGSDFKPPTTIRNDAQDSPSLVSIVKVEWDCKTSNPYGSLSTAKLTLSGRPVRSFVYYSTQGPDFERDLLTIEEPLQSLPELTIDQAMQSITPEEREQGRFGAPKHYVHICGKTSTGEKATLVQTLIPDTCDQDKEGWSYVLPIADRNLYGSGATTKQSDLFCLLLREVSDGVFERVGVVRSQIESMFETSERQLTLI